MAATRGDITNPEGTVAVNDVALKLVHTADWHLGLRFPGFRPQDEEKLTRARLDVVARILGVARRNEADAVLCAGDLFEDPSPAEEWWRALAEVFERHRHVGCPVFLLPGNHDPLTSSSVWAPDHPFRSLLPDGVHIVDRDDFSAELGPDAVLHAAPCRSRAGQRDLALSLPAREPGDDRIRVGMVHGSTFDREGCQTNFPIARDAAERRGFDYLAIGDTHGFRIVPPGARVPTVYPGAPEPTSFGEVEPGNVAVVFVSRNRRVHVRPERVAYWTWEERRVRSLVELRVLRDTEDLTRHVLRLVLDMRVGVDEYEDVRRIVDELQGTPATHGRVGVLQVDDSGLELDPADVVARIEALPEDLQAVARQLERKLGVDAAIQQRALYYLYQLVREGGSEVGGA